MVVLFCTVHGCHDSYALLASWCLWPLRRTKCLTSMLHAKVVHVFCHVLHFLLLSVCLNTLFIPFWYENVNSISVFIQYCYISLALHCFCIPILQNMSFHCAFYMIAAYLSFNFTSTSLSCSVCFFMIFEDIAVFSRTDDYMSWTICYWVLLTYTNIAQCKIGLQTYNLLLVYYVSCL